MKTNRFRSITVKPSARRSFMDYGQAGDAMSGDPAAGTVEGAGVGARYTLVRSDDAAATPFALEALPSHASLPLLMDNVLACGGGETGCAVVVASADASELGGTVVDAIVDEVQQRGLQVLRARLEMLKGGQVRLRAVPQHPVPSILDLLTTRDEAEHREPMRTDVPALLIPALSAGQIRSEFAAWLRDACQSSDLVLIEGPPLGRAVVSATLASGITGLVLVARAGVTSKNDLSLANERARSADARVLGVVLRRRRLHLPAWLRLLRRG